jgi:hypothetical protein
MKISGPLRQLDDRSVALRCEPRDGGGDGLKAGAGLRTGPLRLGAAHAISFRIKARNCSASWAYRIVFTRISMWAGKEMATFEVEGSGAVEVRAKSIPAWGDRARFSGVPGVPKRAVVLQSPVPTVGTAWGSDRGTYRRPSRDASRHAVVTSAWPARASTELPAVREAKQLRHGVVERRVREWP